MRRAPSWLARAFVLGTVWSLAGLLVLFEPWPTLELAALDWLCRLDPLDATKAPVVVVGIDEPSFAELRTQWPWPRDLHARLVDRLREAGAAVIAFDVLFAEPSEAPGADAALARAIGRAGNVVLGAEEAVTSSEHVAQRMRVDPLELLLEAGALPGLMTVPLDADAVARRLPVGEESFWRQALRVYQRGRPHTRALERPDEERYVRQVAPDRPIPFASYYQALEPTRFLPPGFFRDRIVLIGLAVKAGPEAESRRPDMFATSSFAATGRLVPGVEIHAAILQTVLQGRTVRAMPGAGRLAILVLVALLAVRATRRWRPERSGASVLAIGAGLSTVTWLLFRYGDTWLPSTVLLLALSAAYVADGGLAFLRERRLRRQIKRAFTHYVAAAVVDQILARPERLVLGGERRDITVLFGDLAGFTSMSERLTPEEVAQVLNRCLTAVARVVIDHGGTVDKFMGDAIMAFWGAPLDDHEHALHACQAGIAMQQAVAALREERARAGGSAIHLRVGIHSGVAVVGNMGSDSLFDYTAVGDDVNLASRLESANRVYGTGILLTGATALQLDGRIPLRRVDRVRVQGKQIAVEILTPMEGPSLDGLDDGAIDAYRRRDWDLAAKLWQDVLARRPDERIAMLYLERIEQFRAAPPPEPWDGSMTLPGK